MNREEQIKEMARALCGYSYNAETGYCNKSDEECDFMCPPYLKSKRIYSLGYGDTKQAVKEFAERVKARFYANSVSRMKGYKEKIVCDLTVDEFNEEINDLVKEVCGE